MTRPWISLAVLAVVVAALGVFIYLRPQPPQQPDYRISSITAETARHMRITLPGKPAVELARESGAWRVVAPFPARADAFHVKRILGILDATANARFRATDLARFGLDRPQAEVRINDAPIAYGTVSQVTGELYVRSGEWVYPIAGRYMSAMPPAEGTAFIARDLFAASENPVRFEFPQFRVARNEGRWTVAPQSSDLSQDDISRWAENWRHAAASRAEPYNGAMPARHITIELQDGRRVPLGVEEIATELAFTRFDEHVRYYLFPNVARVMLAPPQGDPLGKDKKS